MILANPLYYRDFQYVCCDEPDRDELIRDDDSDDENDCEQSDLVSILLNMAYIPEEVIAQFKFEVGFYKSFKPLMISYNKRKGSNSYSENDESLKSSKSSAKSPNKSNDKTILTELEAEKSMSYELIPGKLIPNKFQLI